MSKLEVGQVIYTIIKDKQIIIPTQIAEQVLTKTLEGEETKFKVLLPNKKKQIVPLDRIEGYYYSLEEAQQFLLDNATNAISKMVQDAETLEEVFFKPQIDVKSNECNNDSNEIIINHNDKIENEPQSDAEDEIKIDLGEGIVGKINMDSLKNIDLDPKSIDAFGEKDLKKK